MPAHYTASSTTMAFSIACYVGLSALLKTTPTDAIRLPAQRSIAIICAGTGWLYVACWALLLDLTHGLIIGAVAGVLALLLAKRLVARRLAAWSAVVILWCPAFVGPFAIPLLTAAMFCTVGFVLLLNLIWRPR